MSQMKVKLDTNHIQTMVNEEVRSKSLFDISKSRSIPQTILVYHLKEP